jgi:FkbM family methyltransferase
MLRTKLAGLRQLFAFDNWPELILDRLFRRQAADIYILDGRPILVDYSGGDASSTRDVIVSPMYRSLLSHLAPSTIKAVVDLGANSGGFVILLRHLGARLSRVVAAEMNPSTAIRLRYNLSKNLTCPYSVVQAAITTHREGLTLNLGEGDPGDSIMSNRASHNAFGQKVFIPTETISDLLERFEGQQIDLLKVDIEGAEFGIFEESNTHIFSSVRHLLIEIHGDTPAANDQLVERILSFGFKHVATHHGVAPVVLFGR